MAEITREVVVARVRRDLALGESLLSDYVIMQYFEDARAVDQTTDYARILRRTEHYIIMSLWPHQSVLVGEPLHG